MDTAMVQIMKYSSLLNRIPLVDGVIAGLDIRFLAKVKNCLY